MSFNNGATNVKTKLTDGINHVMASLLSESNDAGMLSSSFGSDVLFVLIIIFIVIILCIKGCNLVMAKIWKGLILLGFILLILLYFGVIVV